MLGFFTLDASHLITNGMPHLRASSFVKRMFASLEVPYDPYDE